VWLKWQNSCLPSARPWVQTDHSATTKTTSSKRLGSFLVGFLKNLFVDCLVLYLVRPPLLHL
jgi:hypothetical protein